MIEQRLDEIRRWRREHQPLGMPSRGQCLPQPGRGAFGRRAIDRAGLKGPRVGGASVSEKHANFIVNDGRGTASDVRRLAELVRADGARSATGSTSQPEVVFAGDWSGWEAGVGDGPGGCRPARWTRAPPGCRPTPVAVLLGGPSAEHDVSLVSGRAIADALEGGRARRRQAG